LGGISGEFEVLALVFAHGYFGGVVQKNVGSHKRRVGEEACEHIVVGLFCCFVFELCHTAQFAITNGAFHDPAQLRMFRHMALNENGRYVWVESSGEEQHCRLQGFLPKNRRVTANREGMQVNDAMEAL
jgi:hypothetical protein